MRILARMGLHLYQLLHAHQQPVTNPLSYMTIFLTLLWNSTTVSLDELVAGVVSSMAQGRKFLSGLSVENFVISQGDFIHDEMIGLDETCKQNDNLFCELPVLAALRDKKMKSKDSLPGKAIAAGKVPKQSLRICDKEKKNETKGRVISATTTKLVNRIWGDFKVNEDEETGNEDEEIRIEDEEVENTEENMEQDSEVEELTVEVGVSSQIFRQVSIFFCTLILLSYLTVSLDYFEQYPTEASSWYQRKFRGDMSILTDHISKKMNEMNLI